MTFFMHHCVGIMCSILRILLLMNIFIVRTITRLLLLLFLVVIEALAAIVWVTIDIIVLVAAVVPTLHSSSCCYEY